MSARAFWVEAPGRGRIREAPLAAPGPEEVLVEARWSGISRGTESLVFRGGVPQGLRQVMRGPFQEGEFPAPVKYGYMSVGVVSGGAAPVGARVFCLHPHQDRYCVPAGAAVPIPDGVPDRRAVLAANMETALNATWDAGVGCGDRVLVVGAGVIGCLFGYLAARMPGARVQLVDVDPAREAVARALGCEFARPSDAWDGVDLAVHASGTPAGLQCALAAAGFEACVLELSWYGDMPVAAPLGEAFHARRLTLRSSQVGAVAPSRRPRWTHRRRLAMALTLLEDDALDLLLTGECDFEQLPETMVALASRPGGTLCHLVRYPCLSTPAS